VRDPIRVGIIGCGRILPAHLRGFLLLRESGVDSFRIAGLCSRSIEDAMRFRKRGESPSPREPLRANEGDPLSTPHLWVSDFQPDFLPEVYSDYRCMLSSGGVDAVLILTAVDTHHSMAVDALEAGKHVMVEKPLAITVRAGHRMVEAADQRGLVLATAEVARFLPEVRAASWAVKSGTIGKLQVVIGGGIGAGAWSPDHIVARTPWRHQKMRAGGGPAIDIGVHRFHVLRYVAGDVTEVSGLIETLEPIRFTRQASGELVEAVHNEVEDLFFASCRLKEGAVGQINFCWAGHGEQSNLPSVYYGNRGSLNGNSLTRDADQPTDLLRVFEAECDPELRSKLFPLGIRDAFALELYDWLRAIQSGLEPEVPGPSGLRDLATSYSVIESSLAHRWVSVADVECGRLDGYQREIDEHFGLI
jgi:predicted dehydrogenase